jgi:hypothetical protein
VTRDNLVCWKCGASLDEIPLPLSRRAECPGCGAELHVCRMCRFYDTAVANQCREPVAEPVGDKTRANFCGYLEPRADAWQPADRSSASHAEQQLDALFGGGSGSRQPDADDPLSQLESLFGDSKKDA